MLPKFNLICPVGYGYTAKIGRYQAAATNTIDKQSA